MLRTMMIGALMLIPAITNATELNYTVDGIDCKFIGQIAGSIVLEKKKGHSFKSVLDEHKRAEKIDAPISHVAQQMAYDLYNIPNFKRMTPREADRAYQAICEVQWENSRKSDQQVAK